MIIFMFIFLIRIIFIIRILFIFIFPPLIYSSFLLNIIFHYRTYVQVPKAEVQLNLAALVSFANAHFDNIPLMKQYLEKCKKSFFQKMILFLLIIFFVCFSAYLAKQIFYSISFSSSLAFSCLLLSSHLLSSLAFSSHLFSSP